MIRLPVHIYAKLSTVSVVLVLELIIVRAPTLGVSAADSVPRPLGAVEVLSGPTPCDEQECYELSVTCPEVRDPARARLKVGSLSEGTPRGTILFTSAGVGTGLYEDNGYKIIKDTTESGFRSVQLQWLDSWLVASSGEPAGQVRLACRPATVANWVHENIHQRSATTAFCATGHSGGAMQVSYMLTHYGLETIFAAVVPTGGPPSARLDRGCMRDDTENAAVALIDYGVTVMDAGFGFLPAGDPSEDASYLQLGTGPCARGDAAFEDELRAASVASGDGDYTYPRTMLWFVLESIDDTHAVAQGLLYHDLLVQRKSPLVRKDVIPNVDHSGDNGLFTSDEATDRIRDIFLSECRPRD